MDIPRFTLISSSAPLGALPEAIAQIRQKYGALFELDIYLTHRIQEGTIQPAEVLASIQNSQVVMFDLRGNPDRAVDLVQRGLVLTEAKPVAFIPVFGGGPSVLALLRMGSFSMGQINRRTAKSSQGAATNYRRIKFLTEVVEKLGSFLPVGGLRHARNWVRCVNYWANSGVDNLRELLLFVGAEYAGLKVKAQPPQVYASDGFFDWRKKQRYQTLKDYLKEYPLQQDRPIIAAILFGDTTLDACATGSRELLETLAQHANLLPFYADGINTSLGLRKHFFDRKGQPVLPVDALVSLQWFRLEGGPIGGNVKETYDLLTALDAPFHTAVTSYNRTFARWKQEVDGINPVEVLASVTLPEIDGGIDPVFIFGLRDDFEGDPTNDQKETTFAIPGRGKRLAQRILMRTALRGKPNSQKRIALAIYDYPPGEATLGSASFLDVFASLETILRRLKDEGYQVEIPETAIKDLFLSKGLLNRGLWTGEEKTAQNALRVSLKEYLTWYAKLPPAFRSRVEAVFGQPPGDILVDGTDFLLPGVRLGNLFLGLQPARGVHEDPARAYHDKAIPPHHQYIAFYRYLEEKFQADAVVHVGTHGTLEFTPGKEVALAGEDAPDVLMGNMPHIYLYHVVNASEAMIAKRRSYAQMITYASPSFAPVELYGSYLSLEDLLSEFQEQRKDNPGRAIAVWREIISTCKDTNLVLDPAFHEEELTQHTINSPMLDAAVASLHNQLGSLKRMAIPIGLHRFGERLEGKSLLRYLALVARYDREEAPSLNRLLAEARGWKYDDLMEAKDSRLEKLDQESLELLAAWIDQKPIPLFATEAGKKVENYLHSVRQKVEQSAELEGLLRSLSGRFILPNLAGDPIRSPEIYPTGRNAYQFDPTRIPTRAAVERGWQIAEQSIRQYFAQNGCYPQSVGVVLWGFETCKTYGETIGQILGYLGVRLDQGEGYYIQPLPVPLAELGRPRIDVIVNICGFFRDLFPNQVRMLDRAFQSVYHLQESEEQNYVRKHIRQNQEMGLPESTASIRIFGPPPGEYGNRLSTLVENSDWKDESELVEMFLKRTAFGYGDNLHGLESRPQLEACLKTVDLVTQVRDSLEFEVTDVDHYYEFFGGLARSTQELRGKAPVVLIADTTRERVDVMDVAQAIQQGVVSRLLNPQWIDGLLAHDFHGAKEIADRVEYLIGLDATTRSIGTQTWSKVARCYLFDEELRRRMLENNPYAEAEVAQRLAEAERRGYWQPTEEELNQLKAAYLEIESWIEGGK